MRYDQKPGVLSCNGIYNCVSGSWSRATLYNVQDRRQEDQVMFV